MKPVYTWGILVPCYYNNGKSVRTKHHKEWDKVVENIAGGLTVHTPVKGKWKDPMTGKQYHERMIPVRIGCTEAQIKKIAKFTIKHYKQLAVMFFKVSKELYIIHDEERKDQNVAED